VIAPQRSRPTGGDASAGRSASSGPAPRDAAFVVHLVEAAGDSGGHATGRVEHVTTGRAAHFTSADDLLRFMREVLATVGERGR